MDFITAFFGRFHPLLVHLPIGILFLAFLFECLSFSERHKRLRKAVQPALFWGALASIAAAITGFFLRQEGGYDELIADRHQNFGIVTAVLALVVYVLRPKVKHWVDHPLQKKRVKLALSIPLMICLIVTGHWGGSLTHGEDYLAAVVTADSRAEKDPEEKIRTIADVDQAVFYDDVIRPILEARCYDCHSSSKQKGNLRLDSRDFILRGGESGAVISDGPADSSSLYKRLILPLEHDDHMPPNEKPQLSSSEIALIQYWIQDNASFEKPVSAFADAEKIGTIIKAMQQPPQKSWIPTGEVDAADERVIARLRDIGVNPMPMAEGSHYLMVTFTGKKQVTDEQIARLRDIEDQLVWLSFSHSSVGDQQMEAVARLRNLRALYLNNTAITDAGVSKLATLAELRSLSLVATDITDASVALLSGLKNLNNIFLYQTDLTTEGISKIFDANKELRIDTGNYKLDKLPTDTIVYKRASNQ